MEFFRFVFGRTNFILLVVGLLAIIAGAYLTPGAGTPGGAPVVVAWYFRPLEPLGYTLIVTTLVAAALNYSFQSAIEARFAIVRGTTGAGILRVFTDRQEALDQIGDETERANSRLDILCVSGTSLLRRGDRVLAEIGRRCNSKASLTVRILILDPRSRFAVERSLREEGHGDPDSDTESVIYQDLGLCDDTLNSLRQLENVLAPKSPDSPYSCQVRLYNSAPVAMYIELDDTVFVEQYHYGIPTAQVDSPFTVCLGKAVPIVQAGSSSELGHVMRSTFNYLWDWSREREVNAGDTKRIQDSLVTFDWLANFKQIEGEELERMRLSQTDCVASNEATEDTTLAEPGAGVRPAEQTEPQ